MAGTAAFLHQMSRRVRKHSECFHTFRATTQWEILVQALLGWVAGLPKITRKCFVCQRLLVVLHSAVRGHLMILLPHTFCTRIAQICQVNDVAITSVLEHSSNQRPQILHPSHPWLYGVTHASHAISISWCTCPACVMSQEKSMCLHTPEKDFRVLRRSQLVHPRQRRQPAGVYASGPLIMLNTHTRLWAQTQRHSV